MKILIAFASQNGSTAEIADHIANRYQQNGMNIDLLNTATNKIHITLTYDAIILLTPIYKGMWLPDMTRFIRLNLDNLSDIPVFGLFPCIRVLEDNGKQYAHANYVPDTIVSRLNLVDSHFIAGKLIRANITHQELATLNTRYDGELLNRISGDYRDWKDINRWIDNIITILKETIHNEVDSSSE